MNNSFLLIEKFSPVILRSLYKMLILECQQSYLYTEDNLVWQNPEVNGLYTIPKNDKLRERYFYSMALANDLVYEDKHLREEAELVREKPLLDMSVADKFAKVFANLDEQTGSDDESIVVAQLMSHDLSKVAMPTAIVAWLTTDEFRWHQLCQSCPSDLNYGLVSTNPDAVIKYAAFITGFIYTQTPKATIYNQEFAGVLTSCRMFARQVYGELSPEVKASCLQRAQKMTKPPKNPFKFPGHL